MRIQRRLKPDSGIDMTPLIDVVYQLVIFFMITSVFKTAPGIALDLPGSTTSSAVSTTALSVTAVSEDEIYVDKTRTTLQGLDATVKEAVQGRDKKELKAYFQGEKASSYQLMVSVLDVLRANGIENVGLATAADADGAPQRVSKQGGAAKSATAQASP
jgi:biopolymer transport protein ExbD